MIGVQDKSRKAVALNVLAYSFVFLFLLFVLFPILWIAMLSVKNEVQAFADPPLFVFTPTFENYYNLFTEERFGDYLLNSIIIAVSSSVLCLVFGVPMAYASARVQSKMTQKILIWVLVSRMTTRLAARTRTDQMAPNILWYCTDQQRSDTIRAFGNSEIHTPNLDRFAKRGVGFNRAYCQAPICTPSRASMLTGRYPASTQVHRNGNAHFRETEVLVTRILADAGYDCGLIGKLHLAGAENTIEPRTDDGYRMFEWSHHPRPNIKGNRYADWLRDEKGKDPDKLFEDLNAAYGVGLDRDLHQTTWCSDMAIRFIDEKRSGPWMLSINPFAPHPPMFPPQEYLDQYNPEDLSYPIFQDSDIEHQKAFRKIDQQTIDATDPRLMPDEGLDTADPDIDRMGSAPPESYDARLMKACYYAEITLVDEQFGRIIDHLEATDQLDNTLIVFHSDHGEMLGDHGLLYKGCRFFEGLVHVPMMVSGPGLKQDFRSDALVELVDIAPTILDAANIDIPASMQGTSLIPLLSGDVDIDQHKPHVFCEYHDAMAAGTVNLADREFDASHGTMYFDGRYKICVYHGHDVGEIYDLETDPSEFKNLWDDPDKMDLKLRLLKKHVDAFAMTTSAGIERIKAY